MTASISVIITCFNEGLYIEAAVRSVLDQTAAAHIDRIIIADDGSDEATLSVLRSLTTRDDRIQILFGSGGVGVAGQRNRGVAVATTPLIAFLDGDDLWTPAKLARQVAVLEADAAISLVYCGFATFPGGHLEAARPARVTDLSSGRRVRNLARAYFLNDPPIAPSTVLMRRDAFDAVGGFDAAVRVFEDTDFYLRLAARGRFGMVAAPLMLKRHHAASMTSVSSDGGAEADRLIAHHAHVAERAAARDPRLAPLIPRRLAERARKLGNHLWLVGDEAGARRLLKRAVRFDALNLKAWASFVAVAVMTTSMGRPLHRLTNRLLKSRRQALGVSPGVSP